MLVVSDAGPIQYLALIGHEDKLPSLYGLVAVPEAVARELSHPHTPEAMRSLIDKRPSWLSIHVVAETDPELDALGRGERQAIMLARQVGADALLCDDRAAREMASRRSLNVIGTLGILRDAAKLRLLDIEHAVEQLRTRTNFRATRKLYSEVLEAVRRELGGD